MKAARHRMRAPSVFSSIPRERKFASRANAFFIASFPSRILVGYRDADLVPLPFPLRPAHSAHRCVFLENRGGYVGRFTVSIAIFGP